MKHKKRIRPQHLSVPVKRAYVGSSTIPSVRDITWIEAELARLAAQDGNEIAFKYYLLLRKAPDAEEKGKIVQDLRTEVSALIKRLVADIGVLAGT